MKQINEKRRDDAQKQYAKPQMKSVELRHRVSLLQASDDTTNYFHGGLG